MSPRHQKYPITPPELKIEKLVLGFDGNVKDLKYNPYLSVTFASEQSQGKMKKYFLEELESAGLMGNATEGGFALICNYQKMEAEYFGGWLESYPGKSKIALKLECCIETLKWCETLTSVGVGAFQNIPGLQRARARANEGLLRQLVPLLAEELERSVASRKERPFKGTLLD